MGNIVPRSALLLPPPSGRGKCKHGTGVGSARDDVGLGRLRSGRDRRKRRSSGGIGGTAGGAGGGGGGGGAGAGRRPPRLYMNRAQAAGENQPPPRARD